MFGIDDIVGAGLKIIDRFIPDPAEKLKAQQEIQRMTHEEMLAFLDFDKASMQAQADTNKAEAASGDRFSSRWRPFIGWVCGVAFALHFVALPLLNAALLAAGRPAVVVPFDMSTLMTVLLGMLGLGGMRSFEKVRGATK